MVIGVIPLSTPSRETMAPAGVELTERVPVRVIPTGSGVGTVIGS
jgi:hypothetical protein